jgi:hypothetical protein
MTTGTKGLVGRQAIAPLLLCAATLASAVVAGLLGRPVWAAALGAALVLVYWALEALTWRRARERRDLALGLAIGGMAVRVGVVLVVLVMVGLLARDAFATTALAFLASFTVYLGLRPLTYGPPAAPSREAGAR